MKINFTKMQGCGNDYIYLDCLKTQPPLSPETLAIKLSDRHKGIGGDGMVLILPSDIADAKMRMFNADGSEGLMCGNAIRCVGKFLYDNRYIAAQNPKIETLSGIRVLQLNIENGEAVSARVDMGAPKLSPKEIPVILNGETVISRAVTVGGRVFDITCVSMGNPHAVVFCDDIDALKLDELGPLFENNSLFPEKVNTEFVEVTDKNNLKMRVWERGSGETMACGTGACASVVAAVLNNICVKGETVKVHLSGGCLDISYENETVFMTGECVKVFEGTVEV